MTFAFWQVEKLNQLQIELFLHTLTNLSFQYQSIEKNSTLKIMQQIFIVVFADNSQDICQHHRGFEQFPKQTVC